MKLNVSGLATTIHDLKQFIVYLWHTAQAYAYMHVDKDDIT